MAVSQAQFKATLGKSSGMTKVPTKNYYNNLAGVFGSVLTSPQVSRPVTNAQIQAILGGPGGMTRVPSGGGSSNAPWYPTPTGAPIDPTTIRAGDGSGGSVLGASTSPQTTTISSKSIAPSSFGSVSLPTAPTASTTMSATPGASSFDISSLLTPDMVGMGYSIKNGQLVAPVEKQTDTDVSKSSKLGEMFSSLKGLMPKPPSTTEQYQELERQSGIKEKQNIVNSITGQLNAVVAKQQQDLLTTRGTASQEGVTEAVYGGIAAQINREAAIKTLPLAAQLSAAQNDLSTAQDYLKTYASLIINDSKAQYDYQVKMLDSVWGMFTKQEERQAQAIVQKEQNKFTLMRDNVSYARDLAGEAFKSGQRTLAGQITTLMQNPNSPTFVSDLGAYAGQITGDVLERQYKQAQLAKLQQEVQQKIDEGKPITTVNDPSKTVADNNFATLQSVFQSSKVSAGNKTSIGNGLALAKAAQDLADANPSGKFTGFYPLRKVVDFFTPEVATRSKTIQNEALISSLDLQTQFWASGAALSEEQTKLVQKMVPTIKDTDRQVKVKVNQIINYMLSQTSSRLVTDGIDYRPAKVDMFETVDLLNQVSSEQAAELKALGLIQ